MKPPTRYEARRVVETIPSWSPHNYTGLRPAGISARCGVNDRKVKVVLAELRKAFGHRSTIGAGGYYSFITSADRDLAERTVRRVFS